MCISLFLSLSRWNCSLVAVAVPALSLAFHIFNVWRRYRILLIMFYIMQCNCLRQRQRRWWFFFIHRFAIFIVLVLSYCCFLLIFYDRVWNGTFTTFAIITLRCFNEYWARGCRDANRLSAYIGRYSASVSTLHSLAGRLSSPTHTWFGILSLSLVFIFSHGALLSHPRRRRHRCRFLICYRCV